MTERDNARTVLDILTGVAPYITSPAAYSAANAATAPSCGRQPASARGPQEKRIPEAAIAATATLGDYTHFDTRYRR